MKKGLACAALVVGALAAFASPAGANTSDPTVNAATCGLPPAVFRSGLKAPLWLSACATCRAMGPKRMARKVHLSRSDPSYVAQQYARKYSQYPASAKLVRRVGGTSVFRTIVYKGCLAGFRARVRP